MESIVSILKQKDLRVDWVSDNNTVQNEKVNCAIFPCETAFWTSQASSLCIGIYSHGIQDLNLFIILIQAKDITPTCITYTNYKSIRMYCVINGIF